MLPRLCDGPETGSVQPQALYFVAVAQGCRLRVVRGCAVFSEATAFVSSARSESGISRGRAPGFRGRGVGKTELWKMLMEEFARGAARLMLRDVGKRFQGKLHYRALVLGNFIPGRRRMEFH